MTHKTGLSIEDDDLWQWIEDQRLGEDGIRPRSAAIVDALELARAVRETIDEAPYDVADEQRYVREAIKAQVRRDLED
jgi:hypothetical protein